MWLQAEKSYTVVVLPDTIRNGLANRMSAEYGIHARVDGSFDDVVEATIAALKEEGFGVLTDIDVKATMKDRLGVDVEPYRILGACNAGLAHRALVQEPDLGLPLPCNVVVRVDGDAVLVSAVDPTLMMGVTGSSELEGIAAEAKTRLIRVIEPLQAS
jgi:uncharacterized protein (DUF302 family)